MTFCIRSLFHFIPSLRLHLQWLLPNLNALILRAGQILGILIAGLIGMAGQAAAIETYTSHGGPVKGLDLSPDGSLMVSASFDYSAVLWSIPAYEEKAYLIGHDAALNVARFSPDGKWLATGGDDNQVLIWSIAGIMADPDNYEPVIIKAHLGKVVGLNFSKDGAMLVSSSWDGTARIWDFSKMPTATSVDDALLMTLDGHDGPVNASLFSDDGQFLYTAGFDGMVHYWRLRDKMLLHTLVNNGWGVNVMHVDEGLGLIAYGTTDGGMIIHDMDRDKEVLRMGYDRVPVLSIAARPNKSQLAFGNAKGMVHIVDLENMSLLRHFRAANGPVWTLLLMKESGDMVLGSLDDHITRWKINEFPPHILDKGKIDRRFQPTEAMSNGELQFARKCSVCHTLNADGKRRAGPTLFEVFGRRAGTLEGYPYSNALLNSDIVWDAESIERLFSDGPDVVLPGTKMPIQRMKNRQDREDLISYLEQMTKPGTN